MTVQRMVRGGLFVAALAAWACAPATPVITAQPAAGVTGDAGIAGTMRTVNESEIKQARIALERATHPDVRTFAQRMITEHTTADERLQRVLERMKLLEGPSMLATQLEESTAAAAQVLLSVAPAQFDRLYMDNQIRTHAWLLQTLDGALMPAARSDDLKAQLRMVRATAMVHLERARKIRAGLGS